MTRAAAAATAALVAVTVLFLAAPELTTGAPGAGGSAGQPVSLADVLMAAVVGSLGAVALAAVLRRFSRRPRATFLVVCAVSLTLYGLLPVMAAETVESAVWLNVLHLCVATPLVVGMLPSLPRRRAESRTRDLPTDVGNTLQR